MIPFDMSVSFITGQTLALSAKRQLAHDDNLLVNKPLMISLLWMSLIYAPSAMYFYHGWTAWNSVYIFNSTLAIWDWSPCRSGKGGPMLCRNYVKSGREGDITKFPNRLYPCNKALIWLPFCLVSGFEYNGQSRV